MANELDELQRWYESQCNGDWEHTYGVNIQTLDNPGWAVDIALAETALEGQPFKSVKNLAPDREWIVCEVAEGIFRGRGGAPMLGSILRTFLDWAKEPR